MKQNMQKGSVPILILVGIVGFLGFLVGNNLTVLEIFKDTQLSPTSSPPIMETVTKCPDHDPSRWHPAVLKDGNGKIICAYGHEHGDPPPGWVIQAGFNVGFDMTHGFHGNTSEMENTLKHPGMKGFEATIKGVQVYARIHLASNPLDRSARYHSYELFLKDQTGAVSHFQGWLNTGDPIVDRIPYQDKSLGELGKDPGRRPIVWAATRQACLIDKTWCIELWTMTTSSWGPKISWGINDATTFLEKSITGITSTTSTTGGKQDPGPVLQGEQSRMIDTTEMSSWDKNGKLGVDRSLTVTFSPTPKLAGKIWATQFGKIVSGPNDPKCHGESTMFGVSYMNVCLENFIAATLPQIVGVGNTVQKEFDGTGVEIPN